MLKEGFTLVELLVVVSIVTLLSGSVYAYSASARERALDTEQIVETREVQQALEVFYIENERYPANYTASTTVAKEGTDAYNQSMQELVDAELLSEIPASTRGNTYRYYNISDEENVRPYTASAQYSTNAINASRDLVYVGLRSSTEENINPSCLLIVDFETCDSLYPDPGEERDSCIADSSFSLGLDYYQFFPDVYIQGTEGEMFEDEVEYCPYPITP